jgi:hypothetical protein
LCQSASKASSLRHCLRDLGLLGYQVGTLGPQQVVPRPKSGQTAIGFPGQIRSASAECTRSLCLKPGDAVGHHVELPVGIHPCHLHVRQGLLQPRPQSFARGPSRRYDLTASRTGRVAREWRYWPASGNGPAIPPGTLLGGLQSPVLVVAGVVAPVNEPRPSLISAGARTVGAGAPSAPQSSTCPIRPRPALSPLRSRITRPASTGT